MQNLLLSNTMPTAIGMTPRPGPSLDLHFAASKTSVDQVSGRNLITFTRTSGGTYIDSAGILRSATINLVLRSEEFDNPSWTLTSASITSNTFAAPNGTNTADQLIEIATTANHEASQSFTPVANAAYTFSCYVRAATSTTCGLRFSSGLNGTGIICSVDLTAKTANITNGVGTASITELANNWFRVALTATASASPSSTSAYVFRALGTAGSTANSIYVWGAQLEQSSTVGEYVPTTSTINSAPRFDHNPITGESLGLLVEESRTNLQIWSEDFTQGLTPLNATLTANQGLAPNGTQTADQFIETTANGLHSQEIVDYLYVAGTTYTFSCYAKSIGGRNFAPGFPTRFDNARFAYFDLTGNGSVVSVNAGVTASIQAVGNGWYRCTITSTCVTGGGARIGVFIASGTSIVYTGDSSKGLLLWGAQLEAGAFPTSYIPTTTAAATRSADVVSITGTNFSSWYNQSEGTIYVDFLRGYSANFPGFPNIYSFNDGTASNLIALYGVQNTQVVTNFSIQSNGVAQTTYVQLAINALSPNRICQSLATNSSMLVGNGTLTTQDDSVSMPIGINRVSIGSDRTTVAQWGGHIRRLTYYPQRLPNTLLQAITT